MKSNSAAQKAQEVIPTMTIVEKTATQKTANVINFKASAEDTASEEVKPQEVKAPEAVAEPTPAPVAEPTPIIEAKPIQSIEDIKRKSEVLNRLTVKWDTLTEKRRKVENFAISHDGDTSAAIVRDAHGEVFESNSPKTIGKLIEFWKAEFSEAIANVEKEMREIA
ncbi:MAG: hypothetical protein ACOYM7_05500 [Paludibacter sp.]